MKVAVEWVRSFGDFESLTDIELADKLTMAGLEVEEIHGSGASAVFVTKVTPNRGDWMSIYGVAREAAAATSLPLNLTTTLDAPIAVEKIGDFTVDVVNFEWCPRYGAAIVENIQHVPSPQFIQDRLVLSGMRPLNAVVDITNYVMIEIGQPLHAFDLARVLGRKIIVRPAKTGETIVTLDGHEHLLTDDILVIADEMRPIALAGIMGAANSEVTSESSSIVLESAHFSPSVVRRAAKKLGVSTEASYRFERFVDPALVQIAIARTVELLVKYADGIVVNVSIDKVNAPIAPTEIPLRTSRVNKVLGLTLSPSEVAASLKRLGLHLGSDGENFIVVVPTFRPDLTTEIDLIEEVGRMIGYWNLPETVPSRGAADAADFEKGIFDSALRTILVGEGLVEAYSHTLGCLSPFDDPSSSAERVTVRSSLSTELSGLRLTLLPHLLDALALNLRFGAGTVRLFETGKVFRRVEEGFDEPRHVASVLTGGGADYSLAKGVVENLCDALGIRNISYFPSNRPAMHPGRCAEIVAGGQTLGYVAELNPFCLEEHLELPPSSGRVAAFELDVGMLRVASAKATGGAYVPLAKFPSVSRDIALLYDRAVTYGEIVAVVRSEAGELLEKVDLLSVYTGDRIQADKKSVALRLSLRSRSRTLSETDVETVVNSMKAALFAHLAALDR